MAASRASLSKAFLVNHTRKVVLAQEGKVLRSMLGLAHGAMIRGLPGSLVFVWHRTERIAITNWFVFEDLDVAWLDESQKVVDMTPQFRRWSLHTMNTTPARYVIELPAGTLARTRTRVGDVVRWNEAFARA